MAFANLFQTLPTSGEDPTAPRQSPHPYKHEKKRPNLDGPQNDQKKKKKKPYQHFSPAMTTKTHRPPMCYDFDNPDFDPRAQANFHRRGRGHFNRSRGAFLQHTMDKKGQHQNIRNTAMFNQETQQQNMGQNKEKKKKMSWQENPNSLHNRGGFSNKRQWHQADRRDGSKGRGYTRMNKNRPDPPANRVRAMTQEFKDKNAVEVDGRLFCKFFLWDKCVKGKECQLEHGCTFNGMIKDACKFYIQGCCAKGESCAYMHSSFPCKYFHTWGKCSKEAHCRFSHEPLTDITKPLLDQAIQREKDMIELAKKTQQAEVLEVAAEQPSSPKVDVLLHPIRPHFYNSACPEKPPPGTEEVTGGEREHDPLHIESASPPSDVPDPKPVSYSVEAVLGPVHSRPFPSLFGSNRDSTPLSSPPQPSPCPSVTADRVEAPYSVDAVLRSAKSAGGSNLTCAGEPHPSASPSLTFYGSDHSKEVPKPLRDSGLFHGKDSRLKPDTVQSNEAKSRPNGGRVVPSSNPDQTQANRPSPVNTVVPLESQSSAEGNGMVIDSLSSTSIHALPVQPRDARPAKDTQKAFHSLFASPLNQQVFNPATRSNPQHFAQKAASVDANIGHVAHVSAWSLPRTPSVIQRAVAILGAPSRSESQSPGHTPQAKMACTLGKPTHCDQSVSGCKSVKKPYNNSSIESSVSDSDEDLPPLQIASRDSPEPIEVKCGIAAGGVLRGLFAIPIHETAAPPPSAQGKTLTCKPQPVEGSSENSTKTSAAVASLISGPGPKHPNRKGPTPRTKDHQPPTGPVQSDGGLPCPRDAPYNAATTTGTSVFKTLFLNLRPYDQEEQHEILSKSGGKDEMNHRSSSKDPSRTTEELKVEAASQEPRATEMGRRVQLTGCLLDLDHQLQGSCEPTTQPSAPAQHRPVAKNPHCHPLESSGWHAPHTPLAQNPIKQPLKSLFKTLDPSASPFGS